MTIIHSNLSVLIGIVHVLITLTLTCNVPFDFFAKLHNITPVNNLLLNQMSNCNIFPSLNGWQQSFVPCFVNIFVLLSEYIQSQESVLLLLFILIFHTDS